MLLHYLRKLKQFKFGAKLEENANKMRRFLNDFGITDLAYLKVNVNSSR